MKAKRLMAAALMLAASVSGGWACTNFIVGKKASADGSVIVSYAADSYGLFGYLCHYPAAEHPDGAVRDIYEWDTGKYLGRIKEAKRTYNVIGNINEFQVTIGETTFGGRPELVDTTGVMDYGSLIYVALQRSRSAKEAIKVMTGLVKEYGYCSGGESFSIADPDEAWILEMIGKGPGVKGAVWVAVRIPDDCIAAHANQSRIHRFDMDDKDNCLYSPDVISFAREKGYFSGMNEEFSFADAYCPLDFSGLRACEARVWSFYNMFSKTTGQAWLPHIQGKSKEPLPLYVKPGIYLVLHLQESLDPLLCNDLFQKLSFLLLDQKIHIYKLIAQTLRDDHADGALSRRRHTDQNDVVHPQANSFICTLQVILSYLPRYVHRKGRP